MQETVIEAHVGIRALWGVVGAPRMVWPYSKPPQQQFIEGSAK